METEKPNEPNGNKYTIPMLEKGFELLEFLALYPGGVSMQEIVTRLHQPKTSVYRLLSSLMQMGYIGKNEENACYFLSKKLLRLGLAALGESNLVEQALPQMRRVRDSIRESVMLGVLMHNRVVLLEQILGSHNFTFLLRPGICFNLHSSAPGKLFIAYAPEEEREELIGSTLYTIYNKHTVASAEAMRKEVKKIRQNGYATDVEEEMAGVHCVATPVFNQFGAIVAALWTSGPSGRLTRDRFPDVARTLGEASDRISANLGYTAAPGASSL